MKNKIISSLFAFLVTIFAANSYALAPKPILRQVKQLFPEKTFAGNYRNEDITQRVEDAFWTLVEKYRNNAPRNILETPGASARVQIILTEFGYVYRFTFSTWRPGDNYDFPVFIWFDRHPHNSCSDFPLESCRETVPFQEYGSVLADVVFPFQNNIGIIYHTLQNKFKGPASPPDLSEEDIPQALRSHEKWEVKRLIEEGGFGSIYSAWTKNPGKTIAVKYFHKENSTLSDHTIEEYAIAGFSIQKKLRKELPEHLKIHILETGDFYNIEQTVFFDMEFFNGKDLWILSDYLNLGQKINLSIDILEFLHYIYNQGYLYRDIKPDNILIEMKNGRVENFVIVDWDNAFYQNPENSEDCIGIASEELEMGTPGYLSPEHLRPGKSDIRSEVFSFGQFLYFLLTGKFAFTDADNKAGNFSRPRAILPNEISCSPRRQKAIETVILKALKEDPQQRYQTFEEFAIALQNACNTGMPDTEKNLQHFSTVLTAA